MELFRFLEAWILVEFWFLLWQLDDRVRFPISFLVFGLRFVIPFDWLIGSIY